MVTAQEERDGVCEAAGLCESVSCPRANQNGDGSPKKTPFQHLIGEGINETFRGKFSSQENNKCQRFGLWKEKPGSHRAEGGRL